MELKINVSRASNPPSVANYLTYVEKLYASCKEYGNSRV